MGNNISIDSYLNHDTCGGRNITHAYLAGNGTLPLPMPFSECNNTARVLRSHCCEGGICRPSKLDHEFERYEWWDWSGLGYPYVKGDGKKNKGGEKVIWGGKGPKGKRCAPPLLKRGLSGRDEAEGYGGGSFHTQGVDHSAFLGVKGLELGVQAGAGARGEGYGVENGVSYRYSFYTPSNSTETGSAREDEIFAGGVTAGAIAIFLLIVLFCELWCRKMAKTKHAPATGELESAVRPGVEDDCGADGVELEQAADGTDGWSGVKLLS